MNWCSINRRVVDLESGQVLDRDGSQTLPPRLLTLLRFLVANCDRVISRDELIEDVWGHLEAATDDSVNVAISSLRRALGDARRPYRTVVAVPRRGYRLASTRIERLDPSQAEALRARLESAAATNEPATASAPPNASGPIPASGLRPIVPAALLLIAVVTGFWYLLPDPRVTPPGIADSDSDSGRNASVNESADRADNRSVAVLPFSDMSANGNQGPFADGLVDRIIHMLTLSPELEVVARTSSFAFRDRKASIAEIGERLAVDAILEGSVQRSGDTVRVLAQLVDATTERHIWSRTYDRPAGELFALQDDIANEVAQTMTDALLPESDTPYAASQRVWELVTRGRLAMDHFTLERANEAVSHFQAALELQPDSVEALIGLIDAIGMQRSQGPVRTRNDVEDITEVYLQRARELAPQSAMVLRSTGDWHFRNRRPDEAIASYREALTINPNDTVAHRHLGRILFRQGHYDEAVESLRTAVRLDPFFEIGTVWLADAYWAVGRAEEAIFRLRRSIEERPEFPQTHDRLATYLAQRGDLAEAMHHILKARALDPTSPSRWFRVCEFWLQLAADEEAERCTDELAEAHKLPFRIGYLRQIIHGFRGEWSAQTRQLEKIHALGASDMTTRALLGQAYARRDCAQALELLRVDFPMLFEPEPELNPMLLLAARPAIHCLQRTGQTEAAAALLAKMQEVVERTRLERGPWLVSGIERASLHALRGEHEAALEALDALVKSGWNYYWWGLDGYPEFNAINDHPQFIAAQQRLAERAEQHRVRFEVEFAHRPHGQTTAL